MKQWIAFILYVVCLIGILIFLLFIFSFYKVYLNTDIKVNSLEELNTWIHQNIKYKNDGKRTDDFWQYPNETMKLRTGDCEDLAILFAEVAYLRFHEKVELVWVLSRDKSISHMVVLCQGQIFDPTWNRIQKSDEYFRSFEVYAKFTRFKLYRKIKLYRKGN